jgi:hypothetical protein
MPKAPEFAAQVLADALKDGLALGLFLAGQEIAYPGYKRMTTADWLQVEATASNESVVRFPVSTAASDTLADELRLFALDGAPRYVLPMQPALTIRNNDAPVFDSGEIEVSEQ